MSAGEKQTRQLRPGDRVVNDRFRETPVLSVVQTVTSRGRDFRGTSTVSFLNEHLAVVASDDEVWELAPAETVEERIDRVVRGATELSGCPEDGDVEVLGHEVVRLRAALAEASADRARLQKLCDRTALAAANRALNAGGLS